jgi:homocitrate synthase NifV
MAPNLTGMPVHIIDTTLRDGEQAPGVAFSTAEKMAILLLLDDAGVDELEVGIPAMGPAVCREIREMAALDPDCLLTSWCRAVKADIELAADCGTDGVHISFPVSSILLRALGKTTDWVLTRLDALVPFASERFRMVSVGAQDAFRASPDFLDAFVRSAAARGVHRVRIADTVGLARPSRVADMVRQLAPPAGAAALEFHGHNDLGMATANTIAAIEAGIGAVSVTVNGIGERAGNAPLEQVAVAVATLDDRHSAIDTRKLMAVCRFVSRVTHRPIAVDRPITGDAAFSHESGIHCAAVLKDPDTYQPFSPEMVGRRRSRLVVGRHSGSAVLKHTMKKAGLILDDQKTGQLLASVRTEALRKKAPISPGELVQLYHQTCSR